MTSAKYETIDCYRMGVAQDITLTVKLIVGYNTAYGIKFRDASGERARELSLSACAHTQVGSGMYLSQAVKVGAVDYDARR